MFFNNIFESSLMSFASFFGGCNEGFKPKWFTHVFGTIMPSHGVLLYMMS